ncbi:sensor histidine kinase [Cryptosporangium sp. NPDC051539]|uniref:sensor histidine kinase n=1 Tax=Cryptosporangium sp. NPDC051539 TaxID=3363962 RepID=UPI0037A29FF2
MQLVGRSRILVTTLMGFAVVALVAIEVQRPPAVGPVAVAVLFALVAGALAALAAAVLTTALRVRLFQLRAAELPRPVTGEAVLPILRKAVGDPGLEIAYWSPGVGVYVDAEGREVPAGGLEVADPTGQPLATVTVAPASRRSAIDALARIGPALASARLHAVSNAHGTQARALQAGWAERRELEQLLHDSAQTRLSALTVRLGVARSHETDEKAVRVLADAQEQLGLALRELRELAHGIHSMTLTESGLGPALEAAASRYGVPVVVTVPPGRFDPDAEALAYYVACWLFASYQDGSVDISGTLAGDRLGLRISGSGADADAVLNSSIALRVRAAGGVLTTSGTTVDVSIPRRL